MPNNYDFSKVENVKVVEINLDGWISPLYIEYGIGLHGELFSYFWRVKGTQHTFVIPILRMDYLSQGDYNEHFKKVLSKFRKDYIGWDKEEWYLSWMQKYREDFSQFISL